MQFNNATFKLLQTVITVCGILA